MQQPKMDNQNNANNDSRKEEEGPSLAKRLKLGNDEGINKMNMIPAAAEGMVKSKIPSINEDVWFDVLSFITRIHLARSVSFSNRLIHKICWPRLHGNKVEACEIEKLAIKCRERFDWSVPARAILLKDGKEVPFPTCPVPHYITGFRTIKINFLDDQVWEFLKLISPCISGKKVKILLKSKYFDEKRSSSVNQVVDMFRETSAEMYLFLVRPWERCNIGISIIKHIRQMDNKMLQIYLPIEEEFEIPIIMQILTIPRQDGKQRVIELNFYDPYEELALAQKTLDTIKREFHASTNCLPQPFYIRFYRERGLNIATRIEEQNPQTKETLVIMPTAENGDLDICRHPMGDQHETLAEDGRNRLREPIWKDELATLISINFKDLV